jgi:tetratricopeptide (TPR) repeat protein
MLAVNNAMQAPNPVKLFTKRFTVPPESEFEPYHSLYSGNDFPLRPVRKDRLSICTARTFVPLTLFDSHSHNKRMNQETLTQAWEVLQDAYQAQMEGDYERAVELYQSSLQLHPTAEAHTFLGWTYHFQGKLPDAIAECKRAIELDPDFGNPYNDIGAYLIELGQFDEAVPWLQQAVEARRYEPRHFPHYNMGRAYLGKEMYGQAIRCFQEALEIEPRYSLARQALESLRRMVN